MQILEYSARLALTEGKFHKFLIRHNHLLIIPNPSEVGVRVRNAADLKGVIAKIQRAQPKVPHKMKKGKKEEKGKGNGQKGSDVKAGVS